MKSSERIIPLLDMLLRSFQKEEREIFVDQDIFLSRMLWINFREALDRIKSPDYVCLYEDGSKGKNIYAEGFFDGMEAGLKAAGVVVELMEETGNDNV